MSLDPALYATLLALQPTYCWTIGSTRIADCACSLWERNKPFPGTGRLVINAHGPTFDDAVRNALQGLQERGPHLRSVIEQFTTAN